MQIIQKALSRWTMTMLERKDPDKVKKEVIRNRKMKKTAFQKIFHNDEDDDDDITILDLFQQVYHSD